MSSEAPREIWPQDPEQLRERLLRLEPGRSYNWKWQRNGEPEPSATWIRGVLHGVLRHSILLRTDEHIEVLQLGELRDLQLPLSEHAQSPKPPELPAEAPPKPPEFPSVADSSPSPAPPPEPSPPESEPVAQAEAVVEFQESPDFFSQRPPFALGEPSIPSGFSLSRWEVFLTPEPESPSELPQAPTLYETSLQLRSLAAQKYRDGEEPSAILATLKEHLYAAALARLFPSKSRLSNPGDSADSARYFLIELMPLSTPSQTELHKLFVALLFSYLRPFSQKSLARQFEQLAPADLLKRLEAYAAGFDKFLMSIPFLYRNSPEAMSQIFAAFVQGTPWAQELQQRIDGLNPESHRHSEQESKLKLLQGLPFTPESLAYSKDLLEGIAIKAHCDLDRERIGGLLPLLDDMREYFDSEKFHQKEAWSGLLQPQIENLLHQLATWPTHLSHKHLAPFLGSWLAALKSDMARRSQDAIPRPTLQFLLSGSAGLVREGEVELPFSIGLGKDCASIQNLALEVVWESAPEQPKREVLADLRGGESREVWVTLEAPKGGTASAQMLRATLSFYSSLHSEPDVPAQCTERFELLLQPSDAAPSALLPENPYRVGETGVPITREHGAVYVGREDEQREIQAMLQGQGLCFIICGEKRTGKSSFSRELRRQLQQDLAHSPQNVTFLPVQVDISALEPEKSVDFERVFFQRFGDKLNELLRHHPKGRIPFLFSPASAPREIFVRGVRRFLDEEEKLGRSARIFLILEEFTHLLPRAREDSHYSKFLRRWKSLLEELLFNAVLVCQDSIEELKHMHEDILNSAKTVRMEYFDPSDTETLASKPIELPDGTTRYRGGAQKRIFELTAGQPLYTQKLCKHIFDLLKEGHGPYLFEKQVDMAASRLVQSWDPNGDEILSASFYAAQQQVPHLHWDAHSLSEYSRKDREALEHWRRDCEKLLTRLALVGHSSSEYRRFERSLEPKERDILNALQRAKVVIPHPDRAGLKIRIGLFAQWLRHYS